MLRHSPASPAAIIPDGRMSTGPHRLSAAACTHKACPAPLLGEMAPRLGHDIRRYDSSRDSYSQRMRDHVPSRVQLRAGRCYRRCPRASAGPKHRGCITHFLLGTSQAWTYPRQGSSQQNARALSIDQILDDSEAPQRPGSRGQGLAEPQLDVCAHDIGWLGGQSCCHGCDCAGCKIYCGRGLLLLQGP